MRAQSNPSLKEFVLIEYPGIVKDFGKALRTLGGLEAISNTHFSSNPLELQLQPDNPVHSSLVAERHNQSVVFSGQLNLVLRCRRYRKAVKPGGEVDDNRDRAMENDMEITCLGMVSTIYSFRNIYDFQYLPLSNNPTTSSCIRPTEANAVHVHEDLLARLVPCDFANSLYWFDQQPNHQNHRINDLTREGANGDTSSDELDLFLPPYQFSRYNNPSKFLLHDDVDHRPATQRPFAIGHGKSLRTERKALTITVSANDPFPAEPSDEAIRDVELRCKNVTHHRMLAELFSERPLWSKIAIGFRTRINDALLKIIMAKYAFYIMSGPWGRLWCSFGYDPRKDPNARKYQSLMVSFKRSQYIPERQRLRANTTTAGTLCGQFCDYIYRPRTLPALRQMWYSICDIQLPLAQKICRRDYLETRKQCDPVQGWLPPGRANMIRRAIKADVAQTSQCLGELGGGGGEAEEEDDGMEDDYLDDFTPEEEEEEEYEVGDFESEEDDLAVM